MADSWHIYAVIPKSVNWSIVAITTIGYGDITPQSGFGLAIAAFTMLVALADNFIFLGKTHV